MTALKLQAFLKAGLIKDPFFEDGDACAAGRPQPTLPEEVWKAEWAKDHSPKGILYTPILLPRSDRV